MKRKCPWGHRNLLKAKIIGIEIDYCPECGGVFFDKGEFQQITRLDIVTGRVEKDYRVSCPSCGSDMREFTHKLLSHGLSAFHCMKCGGLFIPGKTMQSTIPEIEKISPEHDAIKALITVALLDRMHERFEKYYVSEIFCPFDDEPMVNYEVKNEWGKKIYVRRCKVCGGLFFQKGDAYSIDKEAVLKIDGEDASINKIDHNIPDCPVCRRKMRKFINPAIKIDGVFICPSCYGMWFERDKIRKFKEFVDKRKKMVRSRDDQLAIAIVKKLGPEEAIPYLNTIYHDLKKKADEEAKKPSVPKIAFLSFLFPFLPPPLRIALFFAEDIFYTIKDFLDKRKSGN